jgi:hypothetical protein
MVVVVELAFLVVLEVLGVLEFLEVRLVLELPWGPWLLVLH